MHESLRAELDGCCDRLLIRIEQLKRYMQLSAQVGTESRAVSTSLLAEARGSAIVGVCAELEALTRTTIQRTHEELNSMGIPYANLVASLRQLAAHHVFESLRELQDHSKLWERRLYATTLEKCPDSPQFPIARRSAQPPLDGRTLRPEHFYRIWDIYGLTGMAFPTVSWATSLQKVALLRNDIAHANLPFYEIFKQAGSSVGEVERYLDDIGYFSMHFVFCWSEYLRDEGYLQ
jgi:hypothetical protein